MKNPLYSIKDVRALYPKVPFTVIHNALHELNIRPAKAVNKSIRISERHFQELISYLNLSRQIEE